MDFALLEVRSRAIKWQKLKLWGPPLVCQVQVEAYKHKEGYDGTCWEDGRVKVILGAHNKTDLRMVEGFVVALHELTHAYLFRKDGHRDPDHGQVFREILRQACEQASGFSFDFEVDRRDYRSWDMKLIKHWLKKELEIIDARKKSTESREERAIKREIKARGLGAV